MFKKAKNIMLDFLKSAKTSELIELYVVPAIIITILLIFYSFCNKETVTKFTSQFADSLLTIAALLAAFGIASVTIILTSSSKNIEKAKGVYFDRKNHNNIPISHFQLVIIRNYYNIFIQLFLLIISIFSKFILFDGNSRVVLIIESYILIHSVFTQIFIVTTLYHLMLKDGDGEDNTEIKIEDKKD